MNSFLLLGVLASVQILAKIDQEMRPWECPQTDTLTDWDANWLYNLSDAICYSDGADNYFSRFSEVNHWPYLSRRGLSADCGLSHQPLHPQSLQRETEGTVSYFIISMLVATICMFGYCRNRASSRPRLLQNRKANRALSAAGHLA